MTIVLNIGRRVPRSWFRRQAARVRGLITFQENIWHIIVNSMRMGMKKCNASEKGKWVQTTEMESEDLNYQLQWLKIIIQGSKEFEKQEYEDIKNFYVPLGKILKRKLQIPKNNPLKKQFKTKFISQFKINEIYHKGYDDSKSNNIANKLLEMGILIHHEWIKDFDSRDKKYIDYDITG